MVSVTLAGLRPQPLTLPPATCQVLMDLGMRGARCPGTHWNPLELSMVRHGA